MTKSRALKRACALLVDGMVLVIFVAALPVLQAGELLRRVFKR